MSDGVYEVKKREETGTLRMRRLRKSGRIPGVIYGEEDGVSNVSLDVREVDRMIRAGRQFVTLSGDFAKSALIKDVQWDAFGSQVLHVDFAVVDASEAVEVELTIELRGVAPGTKQGGVVKQLMHELAIRCPADKLPENFEVNINELGLDQSILVSQIELPSVAELISEADGVVVTCVAQVEVDEDEGADSDAPAEPEVIGRKADDEEGDGDS